MIHLVFPLDWPAAALGLIGAALVTSRRADRRRLAFAVWALSNALWIAWAIATAAWPLAAMQSAFLGSSLIGWWNNRDQLP